MSRKIAPKQTLKRIALIITAIFIMAFFVPAKSGEAIVGQMTTITSQGGRIAWSPTGNLLAFDRLGTDNFYDVYTMTTDGQNVTCLTCNKPSLPNKHIGNPSFHPSGNYIIFQAQSSYAGLGDITNWFANPGAGINNDLWIMDSQGQQFWMLNDVPDALGATLHPHFSHDGKMVLWSERVGPGGTQGTWALRLADFAITNGTPSLSNIRTYQPGAQKLFYESSGFSLDDQSIIFSGNLEVGQAETSMDIYIFNIITQTLTNLTNTMNEWDEHAQINPANGQIVWMTSKGYLNIGAAPTDYWIMNSDGSGKEKLTHFNQFGHPEYRGYKVISADNAWSPDGKKLAAYLLINPSNGQSENIIIDLSSEIVIPPPQPPPPQPIPLPILISPTMYPDGIIFKYSDNPTVYIKENGIARPITDFTVYQNNVPGARPILTIPNSITFPSGTIVGLRSGTLIRSSDNPTVYLMVGSKKRPFPSEQEFYQYNYSFSQVYTINDPNLVNSIETTNESFVRPIGTLFKYANSPTVFYLNSARQKSGYTTLNMFNVWNGSLKDVVTIPDTEIYPDGAITRLPNGILVKGSASTIYLVSGSILRPFTNANLFTAMGFGFNQVLTFSDADIALHQIGEEIK